MKEETGFFDAFNRGIHVEDYVLVVSGTGNSVSLCAGKILGYTKTQVKLRIVDRWYGRKWLNKSYESTRRNTGKMFVLPDTRDLNPSHYFPPKVKKLLDGD